MRIEVLIIDPQNDFCDKKGTLYIPGADEDMERAGKMCLKINPIIDDYHVTLDTHRRIHIAHPIFWINSKGERPKPLETVITEDDVLRGVWRTYNPAHQERALEYVKALKANGRYELRIWPYHCLISTWGHNVYHAMAEALKEWEETFGMVDFVTKGSNFWTEHYSAVQADVPDPDDEGTMLNLSDTGLIKTLERSDIVLLWGEAFQFCVKFTVEDVVANFGEDNVKKIIFVKDATSPVLVPGYEQVCQDFLTAMKSKGMQVATCKEIMSNF